MWKITYIFIFIICFTFTFLKTFCSFPGESEHKYPQIAWLGCLYGKSKNFTVPQLVNMLFGQPLYCEDHVKVSGRRCWDSHFIFFAREGNTIEF